MGNVQKFSAKLFPPSSISNECKGRVVESQKSRMRNFSMGWVRGLEEKNVTEERGRGRGRGRAMWMGRWIKITREHTWNQTFTCRSERFNLHAISQRFCRVMYLLPRNSLSNIIIWYRVYGFLFFRCRPPARIPAARIGIRQIRY